MLSLIITSSVSYSPPPDVDFTASFSAWKAQFGMVYASAEAEAKAFSAFAHNDEKIRIHNAKNLNFTLGHNAFSGMTADEFFEGRLGYSRNVMTRDTFSARVHQVDSSITVASAVDWVEAGAVTAVKNQQTCGGCWAFSAAGAIEGAYQIETGQLVSLSEEDLIQCNTLTDSGCNGGLMDNAFRWVESNGIASEAAYPYTSGGGTTGSCRLIKELSPVVKISGFTDVTADSPTALMSAVSQQPVSIAIEADKSVFQLYSGGVMDSTACGTNLDHGVLLVGYSSTGTSPYWKIKNSWGSDWGEDGYIRLGMASSGSGICGMYKQPSYPTGATSA